MTVLEHDAPAGRPLWLPHPGLLAFIAVLWAAAAAAQGFAWIAH